MDNSTNLLNIVQGVNTASNGLVGVLIISVLYLGILALTSKGGNIRLNDSFIISGLICSIVGGLFFFIGLIAWQGLTLFIVLFFASILMKSFN